MAGAVHEPLTICGRNPESTRPVGAPKSGATNCLRFRFHLLQAALRKTDLVRVGRGPAYVFVEEQRWAKRLLAHAVPPRPAGSSIDQAPSMNSGARRVKRLGQACSEATRYGARHRLSIIS